MNMKINTTINMRPMYHFHDKILSFSSGSGSGADGGDGPTAVISSKQSSFVTYMPFSSSVQLFLFAQYEHTSPSLHLQHVESAFSGKVTFSLGAIKPDLHTSSLTGLHPFGVTSIFRSPVCPISLRVFWYSDSGSEVSFLGLIAQSIIL